MASYPKSLPLVTSFSQELDRRIGEVKQRVDVTGRTLGVLVVKKKRLLLAAAERGVRLRLLIVDPQSPYGKQEQHLAQATLDESRDLPPDIELRLTQRPFLPRIARLDDTLLVELSPDAASPMRTETDVPAVLVSRRAAELHTSLTSAFDRAWSEAISVREERPWAEVRSRLRQGLQPASAPPGHPASSSIAFEVEQAVMQMFRTLPGFEVRLDVGGGAQDYDCIAFDLAVGDPILVEIKALRHPTGRGVAEQAAHLARSLSAIVLLMTTTRLTAGAAALLQRARDDEQLRVHHVDIHALSECESAHDASTHLRTLLASDGPLG